MNTKTVVTRMSPATLASFIADLDNMPGDYDAVTLYLMQAALDELFANAGRTDAMHLLAAHDVNASNPLVAAMVETA